jgi:hypothetical protein
MDEEQLRTILNSELAVVFGKLDRKLDRLDQNKADKVQVEKLQDTMDGIAKRLDTDDKERAAINSKIDRHDNWIGQLADTTRTKLVPER